MHRHSTKRTEFTKNIMLQTLKEKNGTQADAYINAGYKAKTRKGAKSNASALKNHPEVKKVLQEYDERLNSVNFAAIIDYWESLAMSTDKRVALEAGKELMKLKDLYPVAKTKIELGLEQRHKYLKQPDLEHYIEVKDKPLP